MAKQFIIVRDARGKITDNATDKEFDNVSKQLETKFNGILDKLNSFDLRGTSELRKIDITPSEDPLDTEATLSEIVNLFSTLVEDLKKYLSN